MSELAEFRCPLCGKPLASDEYHQALNELQRKQEEKYAEQTRTERESFERKLKLAREAFDAELAEMKENREKEIATLKSSYEQQLKTFQQTMEGSYKTQLDELKNNYEQLNSEKEKQFKEIEERRNEETRRQLEAKDNELNDLKNSLNNFKEQAEEEAKNKAAKELNRLRDEILQRDIQIDRFKDDIEELKKQLNQSQPELKGERGELDLLAILSQAFPDDSFRRQKRGTSSGDIIQQIRLSSGKYSETPIVYDNKEVESVTKSDIEKAKSYRDIHGTNYVLIVSDNLPKEIKNGYFGEKDGILIVHSSMAVEVARTIRRAIIEIDRQSASAKDRESKESKLYDYVKSQDFSRKVERMLSIYQKLQKLQETEERAHARLWKDRKSIQSEVNQAYTEITTGIASIIQDSPPMIELIRSKVSKHRNGNGKNNNSR
jgi:hypothetical protein